MITAFLNGGGPKSLYFIGVPLLAGLMLPIRLASAFIKAYFWVLLPLAAVAYLQRGVGELLWGIPTLKYALADPIGLRTAAHIDGGSLKIDMSMIQQPMVWTRWAMAALRAAAAGIAIAMVFRGTAAASLGRASKACLLAGIAAFYLASNHMRGMERWWAAAAHWLGAA